MGKGVGWGRPEGRGEVGGRPYDGLRGDLRVVVKVAWLRVRVCVGGGGESWWGSGVGVGGGRGELKVGGSWWPTV